MAMKVDKKQEYIITVPYHKTIEDLIHEAGFNRWDNNINSKNFQTSGLSKPTSIFLVDFDSEVTLDDASNQIAAAGFRPANIKELLTLAARELLVNLPNTSGVVALGSSWTYQIMNWVQVPEISGMATGRGSFRSLDLGHEPWRPGWKFAIVPR